MLELKNIHKFYNHGTINEMCLFENFNLTIDDGNLFLWWEVMAPEKHLC